MSKHSLPAFTKAVSHLPDVPNLPPQELKAYFDAAPEELRTAHNGLCQDVDALTSRVDSLFVHAYRGLVTGVYSGTGEDKVQGVDLGFAPLAVLIGAGRAYNGSANSYNAPVALLLPQARSANAFITPTGFAVTSDLNSRNMHGREENATYRYIALRPF